ncbi:hypothetical protein [Leptospira levettii]|uniref:hypothetical protein n=1 Tax=Leptospira levettii TaxID=2023178 RepID=UPI00223E4FD3|nr:hypothetical protein [Leptospira levettii]MCW7475586.1 hypothetical protein [Leptospira levettii]
MKIEIIKKNSKILIYSTVVVLSLINLILSISIYRKVNAKYSTKYILLANTCRTNNYSRTETSCGKSCWKCSYYLSKSGTEFPDNGEEIAISEEKKVLEEFKTLKNSIGISYETQYDTIIGKNQECNCTVLKYAFNIPN